MRNFARAGVDWLRQLFGGQAEQAPLRPGQIERAGLAQALAHTEAALADAVCHVARAPRSAELRRRQTQGPAALNAFGSPLLEVTAGGAREAVATTGGLALAGQRVAAFLEGAELGRVAPQLAELAKRHTPLVLHAHVEDHADYHALRDAGAFLALAGSAQEALDLTLVARRVSELALVPALVAIDAERWGALQLADAALIRDYLGASHDAVSAASLGQRTLFGETRRRSPRWFDAARPVSTGVRLSPTERALAARCRVHSDAPLEAVTQQALDELSALTGRAQPLVRARGAEGARWVVVSEGSAVGTVDAVAERLHADGLSCGSVASTWLRPLPTEALRAALAQADVVTVLERTDHAPSETAPLLSELRARLGLSRELTWVSAGYAGALSAGDVNTLFANMQTDTPRAQLRLRDVQDTPASAFPKRQALVQAFTSSSTLESERAGPRSELELESPARVVALVGAEARLGADPLEALAQAFDGVGDTTGLRGVELPASAGVWRGHLALSDGSLPAESAPADLLLIAGGFLDSGTELFTGVREGARVVVATELTPDQVAERLPARWRDRILALDLTLHVAPPRREELLAQGASLFASLFADGGDDTDRKTQAPTQVQLGKANPEPERRPPALVRRVGVGSTHDSVSRFYGEVVQPRRVEGVGVGDPFLAAALAPALTSAFVDVSAEHAQLPVLDTERCTGCGACWSACPDSAIGAGALTPLEALDAAATTVNDSGAAAAALQRAHKHLASRVATRLKAGDTFGEKLLRESFAWLVEKMNVAEEARPDTQAAFDATQRELLALPVVVCEAFFTAPEAESKGGGRLLTLAIDPRACQSCGVCSSVCPEQALASAPRTPKRVASFRAAWEAHERRPEPSAAALDRLAESEHGSAGLLGALLVSKHYAQAVVGGGGSEPGSGQRLATRLVCAVAEHHTQTHLASWIAELDRLEGAVKERLQGLLAQSFKDVDPSALAQALGGEDGQRAELADLSKRLGEEGKHPNLDREAALRLARATQDVERCRRELSDGESGLGRARFGVVVTGSVAEWAATYPDSPFYAPLTVELTDDGVDLARGCAEGLLAEFTALARVRRRASLLSDAPSDLPAQLASLEQITWRDLDPQERAACPPLLLIGDDAALSERGLGALSRLLSADLPLKVVLLDGLGSLEAHGNPTLVAMAHRRAFVLSASVSDPDHFARGLKRALAYPGPALIHVHAPSPRAHGFSSAETLERARLAVLARAHPLLVYDPSAEGAFGARASLAGNPSPEAGWATDSEGASFDFVDWAAGEARFAGELSSFDDAIGSPVPLAEYMALPEPRRAGKVACVGAGAERRVVSRALVRAAEERLHLWTTLQEVCGTRSHFVDRVRGELRAELKALAVAEIEAVEAACAERMRLADVNLEQELEARLRARLTALASQRRGN